MKNLTLKVISFILFLTFSSIYAGAYPDWFLYPHLYGKRYITGYSYSGEDPRIDAERTWVAFNECIAKGKLEYWSVASENTFFRNPDYYYNFSPDSLALIEGKMIAHDAFLINTFSEDIVVLFSLDSTLEREISWVDTDTLPEPTWYDKTFWEDEHYYYGVGMYTARANPNDAWKTAEEKAIFTILTSLVTTFHHITSIQASEDGIDEMEEISVFKIWYRLRNIEVWARWPDIKHNDYMAVVRIPKEDVFSPVLKIIR